MDSASFVAFLRMEADLSEEKAKRLRAQADLLAQQHGVTGDMEAAYGEYRFLRKCEVMGDGFTRQF